MAVIVFDDGAHCAATGGSQLRAAQIGRSEGLVLPSLVSS
jgi:hypothetical protein